MKTGSEGERGGGEVRGGRRPYEPPAIESEAIFETLALACGKAPGEGGLCNAAPSGS